MRDLDTGLVPAVGITPANAPEASVTGDIAADLDAAGWHLSELHIDRAYLASALVRDRGPDLAIFCKAWRVRNTGGRYAKDQFTLDFAAGPQLACPAGASMPFEPGRTVRFPKDTCAACPLRQRCTTSSNGRTCSIRAPPLPDVTASSGGSRHPCADAGIRRGSERALQLRAQLVFDQGLHRSALGRDPPRRATPAPRGTRATRSQADRAPGIFAKDGGADGPLLATRVGRAWLVVQGPSTSIERDAARRIARRRHGCRLLCGQRSISSTGLTPTPRRNQLRAPAQASGKL